MEGHLLRYIWNTGLMEELQQMLAMLQSEYADLLIEKQDVAARSASVDRRLVKLKAHWERLNAYVDASKVEE